MKPTKEEVKIGYEAYAENLRFWEMGSAEMSVYDDRTGVHRFEIDCCIIYPTRGKQHTIEAACIGLGVSRYSVGDMYRVIARPPTLKIEKITIAPICFKEQGWIDRLKGIPKEREKSPITITFYNPKTRNGNESKDRPLVRTFLAKKEKLGTGYLIISSKSKDYDESDIV